MPDDLDLAFGLIAVASLVAVFLLDFFVVLCSAVFIWSDARARAKSRFQAIVWAATGVLIPPLGLYLYLWIHMREGRTGVSPPLVSLRGLIAISIAFLVLFFGVNPRLTLPVTNEGTSMEPTLEENDRLVGDLLSVKIYPLKRGEVVLLRDIDGDLLVKRVIGLPGETIEVGNGQTLINGKPIHEDYLFKQPLYRLPRLSVPDDTYYVLGDNRNVSLDSHFFGPVPRSNIVGKVRFRFWPLRRASIIK